LFLQSIFYYVWLEVQPAKRNFETVLKLLGEAEVTEQGKASKLDVRMKFLEESSPLGANHPAVKQYNKCMRGAGDTVRSIIISANSRLATVYKGNIIKNLIMDCQSYTKYRPNETTGGIFVSWRRKEELPTGA